MRYNYEYKNSNHWMYNQNCHDMKLSIENVQIISFQSIMLQLTNIMKLRKVLKLIKLRATLRHIPCLRIRQIIWRKSDQTHYPFYKNGKCWQYNSSTLQYIPHGRYKNNHFVLLICLFNRVFSKRRKKCWSFFKLVQLLTTKTNKNWKGLNHEALCVPCVFPTYSYFCLFDRVKLCLKYDLLVFNFVRPVHLHDDLYGMKSVLLWCSSLLIQSHMLVSLYM